MNWRRGLFRLWLVFSIVWVAGVVALSNVSAAVSDRLAYGRLQDRVTIAADGSPRGEVGGRYVAHIEVDGQPGAFAITGETQESALADFKTIVGVWGGAFPWEKYQSGGQDFTPLQAQAIVNAKVRRADKLIRETAAFALVPCLVLLAAGLTGAWIIRGFRRA